MAYAYTNTIIATFDDRAAALRAIAELRSLGFLDSQIGLAGPHNPEHDPKILSSAKDSTETDVHSNLGIDTLVGAGIGLEVGASAGAMLGWGIVAGVLPVIGPVILGGALAVVIAHAVGGAAIAGLGGALIGMGVSEMEAQHYEGQLKSGKCILTVGADGRSDEVATILARNGGHDAQNEFRTLHDQNNVQSTPFPMKTAPMDNIRTL